jgi:hypothetical protein
MLEGKIFTQQEAYFTGSDAPAHPDSWTSLANTSGVADRSSFAQIPDFCFCSRIFKDGAS